jgi:hypothetical protein
VRSVKPSEGSCRAPGKRITKSNDYRGPQTDRTVIPHCFWWGLTFPSLVGSLFWRIWQIRIIRIHRNTFYIYSFFSCQEMPEGNIPPWRFRHNTAEDGVSPSQVGHVWRHEVGKEGASRVLYILKCVCTREHTWSKTIKTRSTQLGGLPRCRWGFAGWQRKLTNHAHAFWLRTFRAKLRSIMHLIRRRCFTCAKSTTVARTSARVE